MYTLRFNSNKEWRGDPKKSRNGNFLGFIELLLFLSKNLDKTNYKMIEIGSYMGESTMLFASTCLFSKIYSIDPHFGKEEFNDMFDYDWNLVQYEYKTNLRLFDNIVHYKDYSFNVHNQFEDNSIDFIYIDGNHSYEAIKSDLELYLPKLKQNGIISGHDYNKRAWPETVKAIHEIIGKPDKIFSDTSWIKIL